MDNQDYTHISSHISNILQELRDMRKEAVEHSTQTDIRLAAIEKDLKYHIKRTDLLEESLKPIQAHVNGVNYIFKAVLALGALSGAITKIMGMW